MPTLRARLDQRADCAGAAVTIGDPTFPDDPHARAWLRQREPHQLAASTPIAEQFLTIAPATAMPKTGPAFPRRGRPLPSSASPSETPQLALRRRR